MGVNKLVKTLFLACAVFVYGCNNGDSTSTQKYVCEIPCLKSQPTLSTDLVSSATGGTVEVTFELDGDLANIESVFVLLEPINGGTSIGLGPLWSPTENINTVAITVDAGTPVGEYYPRFSFKHLSPDNTGSQYYRNENVSLTRYAYYEWVGGNSTPLMVSPFDITTLQVRD